MNNPDKYDYGFRQLDPQICRWHVVDAMAEKYLSISPYAYVGNEPVNRTDFLGLTFYYKRIEWEIETRNAFRGGGGGFYQAMYDAMSHYNSIINREITGGRRTIGNESGAGNLRGQWVTETVTEYTEWYVNGNWDHDQVTKITQYTYWLPDDPSFRNQDSPNSRRTNSSPILMGLAKFLRNWPVLPTITWPFIIPNPFYKAEAIAFDAGFLAFFLNEPDMGGALILAGKDVGSIVPYYELTEWSAAYELSVGVEIYRMDYTGNPDLFLADDIYGKRTKVFLGFGLQPESLGFGIGGFYAWSNTTSGDKVKSFGVSFNWGVCALPFSFGINKGWINPF